MKLGVIGVGQAGGKIADQFKVHDEETGVGCVADAMAVNSSRADLAALRHLPKSRRVLVGQSETEGHGVGANVERGAEVVHDDIENILHSVEDMPLANIEAFLLTGGLGGGMGSGGSAALAKYLQRRYDMPVYMVGILPMTGESNLYKQNAIRGIRTLSDVTENIILFDNDEWTVEGAKTGENYLQMNDDLVVRLAAVFGATEPLSGDDIGAKVMDSADLLETLKIGDLSTIGYADTDIQPEDDGGLLSNLLGNNEPEAPADTSDDINEIIQEAALGKLTLPMNRLDGVEAGLAIAAGPADWLSQDGLNMAAAWMEEETGSDYIRTGDYPVETEQQPQYLAGIVVLSGPKFTRPLVELYEDVIGLQDVPADAEAGDIVEMLVGGDDGPRNIFETDG